MLNLSCFAGFGRDKYEFLAKGDTIPRIDAPLPTPVMTPLMTPLHDTLNDKGSHGGALAWVWGAKDLYVRLKLGRLRGFGCNKICPTVTQGGFSAIENAKLATVF